jgi:hypothetical protein
MSRIKLLLDVVSDMRSLADSLQAVADALTQTDTLEQDDPAVEEKPAAAAKPPEPPTKAPALSDVRSVLGAKSNAGFTTEVRELLRKYGAEKLSDIDPSHYTDLLKDAEVLGNAT